MSNLEEVISRGRRLVTPNAAEVKRMAATATSMLAKLSHVAERFHQTRGVFLGGSFAKGTWLPRHVDLDFFVRFDPATHDEEFERDGLAIGTAATKGHPMGKKFAQHPYTEATIDGIRVNVVPCFAVEKGQWKSAADRSPFHVEAVEGLPPDQKTEIRLLKSFMNAVGVYGAEIQRQGFSGYVAEVLVMRLGTFTKTVEWFAEYRLPAEGRAFSLPDPVDGARDLGTAVSGESLGRMVLAAREFLRRPSPAFFREMSGKAHPRLRGDLVAVVFTHKVLSEDTLWGELRKTTRHIVRHSEMQGFKIARSLAASDNERRSAILLLPEFVNLPEIEQRVGPAVDRRNDVEAFLTSNAKDSRLVWVDKDARVRLLHPRRHTELMSFLVGVVNGKSGAVGASKELEDGMKKSARVMQGRALTREASSARWLQDGIREITSDAIGTR